LNSTLNKLNAGDTLYLAPGDYRPAIVQAPHNHLLVTGRNGTATAWITVRNQPGKARPRIFLGGALAHGLAIRNGAYWRLDGLEIVGGNSADTGTNGIFMSSMHHVQIVNCVVRDMGASGISVNGSSQVLIENNLVHGNCKKAAYGPSGISLFMPVMRNTGNGGYAAAQGNPANAYALIVRGNTCFDNITYQYGADGNGIILDCFRDSSFTGRTLVANNVCYWNGMAGIHVLKSNNADIVGNTLHHNQRQYIQADLTAAGDSSQCRYLNNVVVPASKVASRQAPGSTGNVWSNNLYHTFTARIAGANDVLADPQFVAAGTTITADFHLKSGSPASDRGTTLVANGHDRDGVMRGAFPDLGAYEAATVAPPVPSLGIFTTTQDIGAVAAAGSVSVANGTYTVTGSGADIWGTNDEFRFINRSMAGDGVITARVTGITNTNAWAKAGLMIRDGSAANARHASVLVTPTTTNGVVFQRRTSTGGTSIHTSGSKNTAPQWLRLERIGNTITASESADGVAWTVIGTQTMTLPATVVIGLAVTSHADGTLCTATFSNVEVVVTPSGEG
jgi:regulation of enolase protein 1 (concanavalin A-like superfamily)